MNLVELNAPSRYGAILLAITLLAVGSFLRINSYESFKQIGYDENLYSQYVEQISHAGLWNYPMVVEQYIQKQQIAPAAFLPPTRITFLLAATSWKTIFGSSSLESVRTISTISAIVLLLGATVCAWRLGGPEFGLGMAALLAFAPTQLYMAHRALIDGFFATIAFFVIWTLWECLQNSSARRWLYGYAASLAAMVMTKENAAFVFLAILGLFAVNPWLKLGKVSKSLLIATLAGPLIGVIGLVLLSGGLDTLFTAYLLNVRKSYDLPYAIATGDGPWFRYFSDLLLMSPAITILAVGGAFQISKSNKLAAYLIGFVILSYIIMGNLRYGMNLRYALIWDFPLRYLALYPIFSFGGCFAKPPIRRVCIVLAIGVVIYFEMSNYKTLFVENVIYDPVPKQLMHALKMIK